MRAKSIIVTSLLGVFVTLTGCTSLPQWWKNGAKVGPEYSRPHADIASEWRETGSPELKTETAEDPCWWSQFNDPVLNNLIATLHRQNLTLKTAAMRICEARAVRGVTVGNLFPQQQSMDGAYSRSGMSRNSIFGGTGFVPIFTSDWTLGFGAAWELDFWGKFRRAVESSDANLDATIYSYNNAMVLLQAELAATYIQYRTLEERLKLALRNIELQKKTVNLVQERLDAGFVSELDLRQAKAQLFTTESAIPLLMTGHRKAENRICVLLGMPPADLGDVLQKEKSIPVPPPEVAIGIPAELLMRRPDVLEAERRLAAQSARIGVAEADLYPHISVTGQIGLESQNYDSLFNWDSTTSKIMPGFRWDLLNYGRLLNSIDIEDARFCEALWNYRNTVLLANEEAENSLTEYLNEQLRIRKLAESVNETQIANDLALLQYREGVTDFQRVLDSQAGLVVRQDQLAESRGQVAVNLVMVYKALGGGWKCPCPRDPVGPASADVPAGGAPLPAPGAPAPPAAPPVTTPPMAPVPDNTLTVPSVVPSAVPRPNPIRRAPAGVPKATPPLSREFKPSDFPPDGGIPIAAPILPARSASYVPSQSQNRFQRAASIPVTPSPHSSVTPASHLRPSGMSGTTVRLPRVQ